MSGAALERVAEVACTAEIEMHGMRLVANGMLERELAPGIVGWVGVDTTESSREPETVRMILYVGVRHEETRRLVSMLLGLADDDPVQNSKGVVSQYLLNLIPRDGGPRSRWILADGAAHFNIDLDLSSWPVREVGSSGGKSKLNIRDRGVIRSAWR